MPKVPGCASDKGKLHQLRKVVIFSDSQSTVGLGNGTFQPSANQEIWLAYQYFRDQRYDIRFFWADRGFCPLHVLMDQLSKSGELLADLVGAVDPYEVME